MSLCYCQVWACVCGLTCACMVFSDSVVLILMLTCVSIMHNGAKIILDTEWVRISLLVKIVGVRALDIFVVDFQSIIPKSKPNRPINRNSLLSRAKCIRVQKAWYVIWVTLRFPENILYKYLISSALHLVRALSIWINGRMQTRSFLLRKGWRGSRVLEAEAEG